MKNITKMMLAVLAVCGIQKTAHGATLYVRNMSDKSFEVTLEDRTYYQHKSSDVVHPPNGVTTLSLSKRGEYLYFYINPPGSSRLNEKITLPQAQEYRWNGRLNICGSKGHYKMVWSHFDPWNPYAYADACTVIRSGP